MWNILTQQVVDPLDLSFILIVNLFVKFDANIKCHKILGPIIETKKIAELHFAILFQNAPIGW